MPQGAMHLGTSNTVALMVKLMAKMMVKNAHLMVELMVEGAYLMDKLMVNSG